MKIAQIFPRHGTAPRSSHRIFFSRIFQSIDLSHDRNACSLSGFDADIRQNLSSIEQKAADSRVRGEEGMNLRRHCVLSKTNQAENERVQLEAYFMTIYRLTVSLTTARQAADDSSALCFSLSLSLSSSTRRPSPPVCSLGPYSSAVRAARTRPNLFERERPLRMESPGQQLENILGKLEKLSLCSPPGVTRTERGGDSCPK